MKKKIGFPLESIGGWPPCGAEHIWVEALGSNNFRVLNFPFFIKGIAFDDIIDATLDSDEYVISWKIVEPSGNSTMWVIEHEDTGIASKLNSLGCGVEEDSHYGIISVNIPKSIDIVALDDILEEYENTGKVAVAIPVDRIGLR